MKSYFSKTFESEAQHTTLSSELKSFPKLGLDDLAVLMWLGCGLLIYLVYKQNDSTKGYTQSHTCSSQVRVQGSKPKKQLVAEPLK